MDASGGDMSIDLWGREEASLGAGKFENAMKEISDLESLMEKLQVEIKSTLDQINVIEKDEAERRTVERDLQDQITFRERQVDLANCENELRQLQEKQGDADVELLSEQLKKAQDNETNYVDQVRSKKSIFLFISLCM